MEIINIIFIAVGLAFDAFSVAIAGGANLSRFKIRYAFRVALIFGIFQAIMPVIGWSGGLIIKGFIEHLSFWIAAGILFVVGIKMIIESGKEKKSKNNICFNFQLLLIMAVATSIDALAVGFSFAFFNINLIIAVIIIGIITFCISFVGVFLGKWMGAIFKKNTEVAGGIILIIIAVKILLENCL